MGQFSWTVVHGGKAPPPGEVVAPDERLSWSRTAGLGGQHVVAMFGATFVFPVIMGLNPNVAILMSGIATAVFLLVVKGQVPSYLGTSASFVGRRGGDPGAGRGQLRRHRRDPRRRAGARRGRRGGAPRRRRRGRPRAPARRHRRGRHAHRVQPRARRGRGLLAAGPVAALATMVFVIGAAVLLPGFWGRVGVLLGLVFGFLFSLLLDATAGPITSPDGTGEVSTRPRVDLSAVGEADWFGLPAATSTGPDGAEIAGFHLPTFSVVFALLVLPSVIALVAENAGHVKAVEGMTRTDLDPYLGRALAGDGVGTVLAGAVGGSPTTTYAENIGVMAATRVYSTAAYWVAAGVAVLLGFCPKFGALIVATPGGVLGGLTVVLYGMVGLLGAKIWVANRVDLGNPVNLVPLAAGLIIGIGNVSLEFTETFSLSGIALGTLVAVLGFHAVRLAAPAHLQPRPAELQDGPLRDGPGRAKLDDSREEGRA
jgi:xanthine/uracil permease